jgi:hypothetical protein
MLSSAVVKRRAIYPLTHVSISKPYVYYNYMAVTAVKPDSLPTREVIELKHYYDIIHHISNDQSMHLCRPMKFKF